MKLTKNESKKHKNCGNKKAKAIYTQTIRDFDVAHESELIFKINDDRLIIAVLLGVMMKRLSAHMMN